VRQVEAGGGSGIDGKDTAPLQDPHNEHPRCSLCRSRAREGTGWQMAVAVLQLGSVQAGGVGGVGVHDMVRPCARGPHNERKARAGGLGLNDRAYAHNIRDGMCARNIRDGGCARKAHNEHLRCSLYAFHALCGLVQVAKGTRGWGLLPSVAFTTGTGNTMVFRLWVPRMRVGYQIWQPVTTLYPSRYNRGCCALY
jgi:hypothetical protein